MAKTKSLIQSAELKVSPFPKRLKLEPFQIDITVLIYLQWVLKNNMKVYLETFLFDFGRLNSYVYNLSSHVRY